MSERGCIIDPWEAEVFIQNLKSMSMENIGTESWFEFHTKIILLSQQSILEVSNMREEFIKEWFVTYQKIPVLIFEAIQITIWKEKVLPLMLLTNEKPSSNFILYSVLYHEAVVMTLLDSVLFHCEAVLSMEDTVIDLIDYAVEHMTALLYPKNSDSENSHSNDNQDLAELMEKKTEFELDIQIKSVTILRYLAEFMEQLPLCAVSRLLCTHDVPYFFVQLIENRPWTKICKNETMIYDDGKWQKVDPQEKNKIPKIEAQVWLGIREFCFNPRTALYYEMTRFRKSQFSKLQKYLHEEILDQIAPLIDLRRWLSYLDVSQTSTSQRPVAVEIIPEIKLSILDKYKKRWKKLASHQTKIIMNNDIKKIQTKANILSGAYDFDKLDIVSGKKCALCGEFATKRCSKCKVIWYCKRECQVKDWTNHRDFCQKMESSNLTEQSKTEILK